MYYRLYTIYHGYTYYGRHFGGALYTIYCGYTYYGREVAAAMEGGG